VRQNEPEQSKPKEWIGPVQLLFTVGWMIALSILIPTGMGFWLDQPDQFNSRPLYTIIGFCIGSIIAFYGLFRILRQYQLKQRNRHSNKESARS
jgi:F0F1-type ATP synthase assembly protein I